jgi:hypothetical protein
MASTTQSPAAANNSGGIGSKADSGGKLSNNEKTQTGNAPAPPGAVISVGKSRPVFKAPDYSKDPFNLVP